jgi:thiol:disulfide interchange protein
MRKALIGSLVASLVLVAAMAQAQGVRWAKNFDQAMATAKASNKLVMVDFYTEW